MQGNGELRLLRATLNKYRLQNFIVPLKSVNFFEGKLNIFGNYRIKNRGSFESFFGKVKEGTVYRYKDPFGCKYIYFIMPGENDFVFLIGPFLTKAYTTEKVMEIAEKYSIDATSLSDIEDYLKSLPIVPESHYIFGMVEAYCELIWGDSFSVFDMQLEESYVLPQRNEEEEHTNTLFAYDFIEKRYSLESELMESVSKGQLHKAELLFSSIGDSSFEKRLSDPIRNLKNYCIIMNTLLRKAAQNGGVHPYYLDKQSGSFALKIENANSVAGIRELMGDMYRSYCMLVKKHATAKFSSPVAKTISIIDSDLSAPLSLSYLASTQGVSPSYLSSIFKKETGQTVTEHINSKRMEKAKGLLRSTHLQVQTVSQHCGILDVQYFTKLFKKYTGMTPLEYRKN
jgi:AraC-like DNA-binding protein